MRTEIRTAKVETLPIAKIQFIKGNRDLYENHVQRMYDLIEENGFVDTIKVIKLRNKYYAAEGQHRIEALKMHNIKKIPCSIIDWVSSSFDDVQRYIIDLNAHNKGWNLYDYIKSWADDDKKDYVYLKEQIAKYNKNLSVGSISTCYDGHLRLHQQIRKGKFKIKDKELSDYILKELYNFVDKFGKAKANSKIVTNAAYRVLMFKGNKRKLLKAFLLVASSYITANKEPLPDGEKAFTYWFENSVVPFHNELK
jgi:hypothetical protein